MERRPVRWWTVLTEPESAEQHLAGVSNVPLEILDATSTADLDRATAVLV
jgi:hypothetical protein